MNKTLIEAFDNELILGFDVHHSSSGVEIAAKLSGILADQAVGDEVKASGMNLEVASNILVEQLVRLVHEAEGAAQYNLKRLAPLSGVEV